MRSMHWIISLSYIWLLWYYYYYYIKCYIKTPPLSGLSVWSVWSVCLVSLVLLHCSCTFVRDDDSVSSRPFHGTAPGTPAWGRVIGASMRWEVTQRPVGRGLRRDTWIWLQHLLLQGFGRYPCWVILGRPPSLLSQSPNFNNQPRSPQEHIPTRTHKQTNKQITPIAKQQIPSACYQNKSCNIPLTSTQLTLGDWRLYKLQCPRWNVGGT